MILQRIAQDLKTRDWGAAFIEVGIVVIGIFIGLQVDDWNEARKNRSEARVVLDRLERDFERNLALTQTGLEVHARYREAAGRLIEGIRSQALDAAFLGEDLQMATRFNAPPAPSVTFQELVSEGRLSLIANEALRQDLYAYNDLVPFIRATFTDTFITPLIDARTVLLRARSIDVSQGPSLKTSDLWQTASVESSVLLSDPEMLVALQSAYGTHDNIHVVFTLNERRIRNVLEKIRQEQQAAPSF